MKYGLADTKSNLIIAAGLIFLSLIFTAYSNKNRQVAQLGNLAMMVVTNPFSSSFTYVSTSVSGFFENYVNLFNVQEDNHKLREQLKFLQSENARFRESAIENKRLHQILKFAAVEQRTGLVAQVIAYGNKSQQQTITVNRGSTDGVKLQQVAVDGVALLGQVVAVTKHSAKILLISDALSGVDSLSQETRVRGIIQGSGNNQLNWNFIPKEHDVEVGSRVITSGADGIYPQGLLVGVVLDVSREAHGLFQEVLIKPAVDLKRIETVYLLDQAHDES